MSLGSKPPKSKPETMATSGLADAVPAGGKLLNPAAMASSGPAGAVSAGAYFSQPTVLATPSSGVPRVGVGQSSQVVPEIYLDKNIRETDPFVLERDTAALPGVMRAGTSRLLEDVHAVFQSAAVAFARLGDQVGEDDCWLPMVSSNKIVTLPIFSSIFGLACFQDCRYYCFGVVGPRLPCS